MAQWVTIWRAAHLLDVPRDVLQQRVRAGEIELTDGLVSTEALLALYPQAQIEPSGMLERVAQIRDESFGRRVRERLLPSQEVLAQRMFHQSQELADVQRHLQRYHALVVALRQQIRELQSEAGRRRIPRLLLLERQLNDGLARALATEPVDRLNVMDDMLKVMSAQVTVRPSGNQFTVEGRDTLLTAAVRAGLNLNYGCGNGTCGMCKVRLTAGEVARTMPSDYPLSEAEKAQGYVLACAHTAASSELTIETLEAAGPSDIPQQQLVATVRAIRPLGPDTHAAAPADTAQPAPALPGRPVGDARRQPAARVHIPGTPSPAVPATTATCTSSSRATGRTGWRRASSAASSSPATR